MTKEQIFGIIKINIMEILPDIDEGDIGIKDSMKDLGTNSLDRFDVLVDTMEEIGIKVPLLQFGKLKNIEEITELLYANQ